MPYRNRRRREKRHDASGSRAAVARKQVSSVELTRECLKRIDSLGKPLNAFITVTEGSALAEAEKADRERRDGMDRGPLHGIPIAHKDLFCTRGLLTTAGSLTLAQHVPSFDAAVVERLREAATHGFRGVVTPYVDGWAARCSPHILDPYGRGACDVCPGLPSLKVVGTDLRRFTNSPITKDQV